VNLNLQIEDQKRKSNLICNFVIETSYIKELASQVLNADEAVKNTPVFEQACETLRDLCDRVSSNLIDLRDMIPRSNAEPEIMPPLD
jgi:hypothetical protein